MMKNCTVYLPALIATLMFTSPFTVHADEQPIAPAAVKLGREINYAKDIVPILKKNCIACHNAKTKQGELNLESPALMIEGGESGAAIVPGKPEDSYLYLVASRTEEPVMPPLPNKMNAHQLTGEEVWKLRQWIQKGAKGKASLHRMPLNWMKPTTKLQPIYSLTLTPNDDFVVSGIGNRVEIISLTDTNNRLELIDPELKSYAHRDFINAVAVDPTGEYIASAGYRVVKIWSRSSPKATEIIPAISPIVSVARSNNKVFYCLVNQSGKVFVGSTKKTGSTWDSGLKKITATAIDDSGNNVLLSTGSELHIVRFPKKKTMVVKMPSDARSIAVWGSKIITGHADGLIRIWNRDEKTGNYQPEKEELKKHKKAVTKLEVIADNPAGLVSFSSEGLMVHSDLATKKTTTEWKTGADVISFALSADRKKVATAHRTGRVLLWDEKKKVERGFYSPVSVLQQLEVTEENVAIAKSISVNIQAQLKAAEKSVTVRKAAIEKIKKAVPETVKAFEAAKKLKDEAATALAAVKKENATAKQTPALKKKLGAAQELFDEKQKVLTTADQKKNRAKKTVVTETASLQKVEEKLQQAKKKALQGTADVKLAQSKVAAVKAEIKKKTLAAVGVRFVDKMRLQVVTKDGVIEEWNLTNGLPAGTQKVSPVSQCEQVLPLVNDKFVSVDTAGRVHLVDTTAAWKLRSRLGLAPGKTTVTQSQFVNRIASLAFSPDGKMLATGGGNPSHDGELMLWDWKAEKVIHKFPKAHNDVVLSVKFSHQGKHLLTGSADRFAKIFDSSTGKITQSFEGHTAHVLSTAWRKDGLNIATAGADKTIKIWDTQTGIKKRTIGSAGKQMTDLTYVGATDFLVSSCGDRVVRLHRASNAQLVRNFNGASNYLYAVAVTRKEEFVIGAGQSGVIRVWNGKNGKLLNSISPANQ